MHGTQVIGMSFEVVFTGALRDGFSRRQGIDTLCHKFGLDFGQVKSLLCGSRRVVKRAGERRQAEKIVRALWDGGWHSELLLDNRVVFRTGEARHRGRAAAGPDMVRHYSADSTMSLYVPRSWQPCTDLNPCALLQAGDRERHHYVVILKQARRELPPALTLSAYAAGQLQQCVSRVSAGQLLSGPATGRHEQLPLCTAEMSAQLDGTAIRYRIAHFQCEQNFYTIFLWCDGRDFAQQRSIFSRIISSFSVVTGAPESEGMGTVVQDYTEEIDS